MVHLRRRLTEQTGIELKNQALGPTESYRTMKSLHCLILGLTMALFSAGCSSPGNDLFSPSYQPRTKNIESVTLRAVGESGQTFVGRIRIDGGPEREISGTTSAEFPLQVCWMRGSFKKIKGEGTVRFLVQGKGHTEGFGELTKAGSSCRFGYHDRMLAVSE
jgi:hypothetical protein